MGIFSEMLLKHNNQDTSISLSTKPRQYDEEQRIKWYSKNREQ